MYHFLILVAAVQEAMVAAKDGDVCQADSTCWKVATTSVFSRSVAAEQDSTDKRKLAATGDVFIQSPTFKLQHVVAESAQDDAQDIESTRAMEDMLQREQVAEINMLESQLRQEQAELGLVEQRLGQVERRLVQEESNNKEQFQRPVQEQGVPPGLLVQEQMLQRMPGVVQLPPLQAAQLAQRVQFAPLQAAQVSQAMPLAQGVQFAPLQAAQISQAMPVVQGQVPQLQGLQGWVQPVVNNVPPPLQQINAAMVAPLQGDQPNPAVYAGVR